MVSSKLSGTSGKRSSSRRQGPRRPHRLNLLLEQLEQRQLLAGLADLMPALVEAQRLEASGLAASATPPGVNLTQQLVGSQFDSSSVRRELVIIDSATPDYERLLGDILNNGRPGRQIEALLIDSDRDGVRLIGQILQSYRDLDAVHIISHGSGGQLQLGDAVLSQSNLGDYASSIRQWSRSLNDGADLLLYGCELAGDDAGQQLLGALASLTGADVAASRDVTGHALLGGNWELEFSTGPIETSVAFSADTLDQWQGTLANFIVEADDWGGGDTFVDSVATGTNYGGSTFIEVQQDPPGPEGQRNGLIYFDLNSVTGTTVNSARLQITTGTGPQDGTPATIEIRRVTGAWSQGAVTWASQPTVDPALVTSFSPSASNTTYTVDITSLVQAWLDDLNDNGGNPNFGIQLTSTGTNDAVFISAEATDQRQPTLLVNTSNVQPFPAGSYIIDMGQSVQTLNNSIKPFGMIYDLTFNYKVPVSWAIDATKDFNFATQGTNTPAEPVDTIGDTIDLTATITGSVVKNYRGGPFIIHEHFITPTIVGVINKWRAAGVIVDQTIADFTADVHSEVSYFPKSVFNEQNSGLVQTYFTNAGFYSTAGAPAPVTVTTTMVNNQPVYDPPLSVWKNYPTIISGPMALNACFDVFLIPHAEPSTNWTVQERQRFLEFVDDEAGGVWAADHTVSEIEGQIDVNGDMQPDTLFLTNGTVWYKNHANLPTPPYRYVNGQNGTYDTAADPVMQIQGRYDGAITNGSEHTYVPTAPVRPTTRVSLIDPDHVLDPTPGSDVDPRNEVFLTAYGPAFGDPSNGFISYQAGHTLTRGTLTEQVAGQRTFFNFLLTEGARRQPRIDAVLPTDVFAGSTNTFTATISGGSGTYMYQWVSTDGGVFSNPSGTWKIGDPPIMTDYDMNSPQDTISLIVIDACGRQTIFWETLTDAPPTIDLDGDDTTTPPGDTGYNGTWQAGGVPTPVTDPDVVVTDSSGIIVSAVIDLTNRLDGANETLTINQTLAGMLGITVTGDGDGGFLLSGAATLAEYEQLIATLQYVNNLTDPTRDDRVIEVTVNDGASDSNTAVSTLVLNQVGCEIHFTLNDYSAPVNFVLENSTLYVQLDDVSPNYSRTAINNVTVTVTNPDSGDSQTLTLTETAVDSFLFQGSLATSKLGAVVINDGTLIAADDDVISVTYIDPDDPADTCTAMVTVVGSSRKQLYLTDPGPGSNPTQGLDRNDPVANGDMTTSMTGELSGIVSGSDLTGLLAYSNTGNELVYRHWMGDSFGGAQTFVANRDDFRVMQGAASSTRDEKVVIGLHDDARITGAVFNGTAWTEINLGSGTDLSGDLAQDQWWAADVAYEGSSGDAIITYATTGGLRYAVWNGATWTSALTITTANGTTPRQMRLAADPNSDEMVLVVNFNDEQDRAFVWNGSAWGNEVLLDNNTLQHNRTDIYVAYESQSGDAIVVYADGTSTTNVAYQIWNGSSWSGESLLAPPATTEGTVLWTTLASDPNSDRIALGVLTSDTVASTDGNTFADAWFAVWDGSAWTSSLKATSNVRENTGLNISVAFESTSGDLLATYGTINGNDDSFRYRTWDGVSWSGETTLDGAAAGADRTITMTLDPNPFSDQIMLTVGDNDQDINTLLWDGSTFGTPAEVETASGTTVGQPFTFLWDEDLGTSGTSFTIQVDDDGPDVGSTTGGDTYIRQDDAGMNFGSSTVIESKFDSGMDRIGLIQFDLSGLTGVTVEEAYLDVTVSDPTANSIQVRRVDSAWTESTVTWTMSPTINGSNVATFIPSTDEATYSVNITTLVQQWLDNLNDSMTGQANNGLALVSTGSDIADFYSKEGSVPLQPTLRIFTTVPGTPTTTFTQNIPMTSGFNIPDTGEVTVSTYIEVTSGTFMNPPDIDVTLREIGTAPNVNIPITSDPMVTPLGGNFYRLDWTTNVSGLQVVETGNSLELEITSNESLFGFRVLYDSATYPSQIVVDTTTVINVSSLNVFSAAYPGGMVISSANPGDTVYLRTTVTDPFGADDITDVDLIITDSLNNIIVNTTLDDTDVVDPSLPAPTSNYKTYQYAWTLPLTAGDFTVTVIANEGTEGVFDLDVTDFTVNGTPDLAVTKTDGGITASVGQTVVYTINYQNVGDGSATGVTLTETLPAYTTFNAGASTAGWVETPPMSGTYVFNIPGTVAIGGSGNVLFAVTVGNLPAGETEIDNFVTVTAPGDTNAANDTAMDDTPIIAAPDMAVTKDDGGATAMAGGNVTYTINYSNVGTQGATGVVLTETIPPNTTVTAASLMAGWTLLSGSTYTYSIPGEVAADGMGSVPITLTVANPVPAEFELMLNTVSITDDGTNGPDPNLANNQDTDDTPIDAAPDLVITKDDGGAVTLPGGIVAYTITYTNVGTQHATGVNIEDIVPDDTTFNLANSTPGWDLDGNELNFFIGDLPVGASGSIVVAFDVSIAITPGVDIITNTATIVDDGLSGPDENPADNTDTDTTPTSATPQADLAIDKDDFDLEVTPGDTGAYTITVTNLGPDPVAGATVTDIIPAGLTGVTWTSMVFGGALASPGAGAGNISDTVTLPVGGTIVYTLNYTVAASAMGTIQNVASVTMAGLVDPDLSNNTDDDINQVIRPADLELDKSFSLLADNDGSGLANFTPGDTILFTVVVTNDAASPFDATGVQVNDILPTGYTFVSSDALANGYTYTPGTGLWNIGPLAIGQSATLNITATVQATGNYTNYAQVSASDNFDPDSTPANGPQIPDEDDDDSVTPVITPKADLELNKLVALAGDNDGSGGYSIGDTVIFTLSLVNQGPNATSGVTVTDMLPAGYSYVTDNGLGAYDPMTGLWTVGSMNVLDTRTLQITATINSAGPGEYANYAQVSTSSAFDPDSDPGDNSTTDDDDATATPPISDLSLSKVVALLSDLDGSGGYSIGDTVRFTLTVSNAGPDLATGVLIRDTLPAGYTYLTDNGGAATTESGGVITWDAGAVTVGGMKSITIDVTINGNFSVPAGNYRNYAEVIGSDNLDPDSTPGDGSQGDDDDTTAQPPISDLRVLKFVQLTTDIDMSGSITANDLITFVVRVTNDGPDQATGVDVQDVVPSGYSSITAINLGGMESGGTITWSGLTINAGSFVDLTFQATVNGMGDYTNVAQVTGSDNFDPDSVPNNNIPAEDDQDDYTPTIAETADLELTKTVNDATPNVGDTITYTITVTNDGPNDADNVSVLDLLPLGLLYDSHSGPGSYDSLSGIWDIGTILNMGSAVLTIDVIVGVAGTMFNTAQVWTADQFDPDSVPGNDDPAEDDQDSVSITAPPLAAIGNRVWLDENGNGIQDAGEDGIAGVTVELRDAGNNLLATTATGADGGYIFTDLVPNVAYTVTVLPPAGLNLTFDPEGAADSSATVTPTPGQERLDIDFGYNWVPAGDSNNPPMGATGAIGDRIWNDVDGDGVQDPGEIGLAGITVRLLVDTNGDGIYGGPGDAAAVTTVTNSSGNYIFDGLVAGAYVIDVLTAGLPAGWNPVPTGDPDGDGNTTSNPIELAPGDVFVNADFGFQPDTNNDGVADTGSSIGDQVFIDINGDGVKSASEPGIAGVTVTLLDSMNNVVGTTTTNSSGTYLFPRVPAGTYTVVVTDTDNVLMGLFPISDADGGLDQQSTLMVDGTSPNLLQDFGYAPFGQNAGDGIIGDTIFIDTNGSGTFNTGEGVEGVTVELYDATGTTLLSSTVTNENGQYFFGDLSPTGTYTVRVVTTSLPNAGAGLTNTIDPDGLAANESVVDLSLTGGTNLAQDFGYDVDTPGSITGTVWRDTDADGTLEVGETGRYAGVTIVLLDSNGNIVASTTTDANGNYTFAEVAPGVYIVDVTDQNNVLAGAWHSLGAANVDNDSQSDPYLVAVMAMVTAHADFGYYSEGATLGDFVWNDLDGDGIQEMGEYGVPGVPVTLTITYPNGDVVTIVTVTDGNGAYSFGNLLSDESFDGFGTPGIDEPMYVISVGTPPGRIPTLLNQGMNDAVDSEDPAGATAFPLQGQTNNTYDFGFVKPAVIGNRVWLDEDGDGVQDAGEDGIAGAIVELYADTDNDLVPDTFVAAVVTGTDGGYIFTNLPPNIVYAVAVQPPVGMHQTYDLDGLGTPNLAEVVPTGGEEFLDADFGYNWVPPASTDSPGPATTGAIGDRVWIDADDHGVQNPGEAGLGGVTVTLYSAGPDGIFGNGDDPAPVNTVTNAAGNYIFNGLPPGYYQVVVNGGMAPAGYTQSGDPDALLDNATLVVLAPGDVYVNADFGYDPAAGSTIGDTVFIDRDGDGIQDPGEPGIPGVTIDLLDAFNNVIATTTTDQNGQFSFPGLPMGDYTVQVTDTDNVLGELTPISDDDGPADGVSTVTVDGVNDFLDEDFGYAPYGHTAGDGIIGDTVFIDTNNNGLLSPGEGVEGVTVSVRDSNGNIVAITTTDENGNYTFGGLDPNATYTVFVDSTTLPNGGVGLANTIDPDGGTGSQSVVNLMALGGSSYDQDFGYRMLAMPNTISGTVWDDSNADGTLNEVAPNGIPGVTVVLRDADGNVVATTTTNASGNYSFTNVPDGTYTVDVTDQHNVLAGYWKSDGPNAGMDNNSQVDPYSVSVAGGQIDTTADFGYYVDTAAVGDYVWNDLNGNGLQDANEPGIPGVDVTLTITYPNGAVTTLVSTTDANGFYSFGNLLADEDFNGIGTPGIDEPTFVITMATPSGMTLTGLDVGNDETIDSENPTGETIFPIMGVTDTTIDFGFYGPASIGNRVWLDEDGDGVQDAGEDGIPNVTVTLDPPAGVDLGAGDGVPITTTTGADGSYVFNNLPPDVTYTVTVTPPAGLEQTFDADGLGTPNTTQVTPGPGEEAFDTDFGYTWSTDPDLGAIGDRVWNDANGDGVQDPGEIGLEGITVRLYSDPNNDGVYDFLVDTAVTGPDGYYIFDDVPAGAYVIEVNGGVTPGGYTQTGDPDGVNDNRTLVILSPGDVYVNADFGYDPAMGSTIGDAVFVDADLDGIQDANEPGIPGVTVNLLDDMNNVVGTTTTDANGNYFFPDVPAGTYTVVVTDTNNVLGDLIPASDDDGPADGVSTVVADGVNDFLDEDFGYAPAGHDPADGIIGDTIFIDTNNDGMFTAGEGVEGVLVTLLDSLNNVVGTTTTNENGQYFFGNLDPMGVYTVVVDPMTLPGLGAGLVNTIDPDMGTANQSTIDLGTVGGVTFDQDFGYTMPMNPNTISGTVWNDTNADGTLNEAPPNGLAGVTVELRDALGNVVATTTTDGNGDYSFTNIPDGTYTVDVTDTNNVLAGYWHSDGPNDGFDNNSQDDPYTVSVGGGQTDDTADFGYYIETATIGDFVWNDVDGDGVQDMGELGISGATVTLTITYPDGTVTTVVTTTDANGAYSFGNLLADENFDGVGTLATPGVGGGDEPVFVVSVTTPPQLVPSPPGQGGDPALDSDVHSGTIVPILQGETDNTIDFGFAGLADLSLTKAITLAVDADSSGNISAGDTVTFTILVSNDGPAPANGVGVEDNLPAGYTYVPLSANMGGTFGLGVVSWSGLTAPVGMNVITLTFDAVVVGGLTIADYTNYAQITASDNPDPDSTPNDDSMGDDDDDTIAPAIADVSLLKSISDTTPVIGQTVTFTITVSNAGPDAATNVQVTDILPDGFAYAGGTIAGGSTQNDGAAPTLVWTIASLASG
ncbi:MAG: carboxypeptidase regulatory-like domain-containing protein, partial [Pirellulaceae bacterium]|nr:carboxypeptidase regulatory-like domain-containing protein [Pirellulaceae bacterium]